MSKGVEDIELSDLGGQVLYLPFFKSDHPPLRLRFFDAQSNDLDRQFPSDFVASWILHENFADFVRSSWHEEWHLLDNIYHFTSDVKTWRYEVFGHLGRRRRHLLNRLETLNNTPHTCLNEQSLDSLIHQLWRELEEVLIQEDLLWVQKAKCD
ncbi:hypothetical protein K1719_036721 [Acacia pycnantha]|nr:hypothetical protein K1719_036721 [Acacia pycnantha]